MIGEQPKRKHMRLPEYDYNTAGAYFVTICTQDRKYVLRRVAAEIDQSRNCVGEGLCALPQTRLTNIGAEVEEAILHINNYTQYSVDNYVIMPNHIHLLITISEPAGGHRDPPLQAVIGQMKSYTTRKYGKTLWQRSFYDHIIRDMNDYLAYWQYIDENPAKWELDEYHKSIT